MLVEVSRKEGYELNPEAFFVHETGTNFADIKGEFGEELFQRMFICQWHFEKSTQQKVNIVGEDYQEELLKLCYDLYLAATAIHYNLFKSSIDNIVKIFAGLVGDMLGNLIKFQYLELIDCQRSIMLNRAILHSGIEIL